jgi:DNA-binding transcriptional MerR regulator
MRMEQKTFRIGEVAEMIGRNVHTIRVWGYHNRLPDNLKPVRNERGWRVWTEEQVEGIKAWIISADMTPGKAFRKK